MKLFICFGLYYLYLECSAKGYGQIALCENECAANQVCNVENDVVTCTNVSVETCKDTPCLNGVCQNTPFGFTCYCDAGWTGALCETNISLLEDACSTMPCRGDCQCVPSCRHELGYFCISPSGFIGKNCTIAVPRIRCDPSEIVVDISTELYTEFDGKKRNSYIYISPTPDGSSKRSIDCRATFSGGNQYQIKVGLPFNGCGTFRNRRRRFDEVSFTNRIWINRGSDNGRYDMPVSILQFECIYAQDYEVIVSSMQPMVDPHRTIVTADGTLNIDFDLCKVDSCPGSCPKPYNLSEGAVYTVGENIHLLVTVNTQQQLLSQPRLVTTLEEVFLSCHQEFYAPRIVNLLNDGCPVQAGLYISVHAGKITASESACITFQVPRVTTCSRVYIHLKTCLCHTDYLQQCRNADIQHCRKITKRSARLLEEYDNDVLSMVGPITIISGERGSKWMKMYPDEGENKGFYDEAQHEKAEDIEAFIDDSQNSISQGKDKALPAYVAGTSLLVLSVLSVAAIAIRRNGNCFSHVPKPHDVVL
ncbi:unnamed protein product [Clavelina lepadiformis]|uniref:Uncharacterized protein n=1 Tax=Clavelina lepadiformis TaxID=159417 RepID=A0ABP0GSP6_CLALP